MKVLAAVILSFCTYSICAQDIIHKRNGETIRAKVVEVTESTLRYKSWENLNGPDYVISKDLVKEIHYENGTVDYFDIDFKQRVNALNYDSLMRLSHRKKVKGIIALSISGACVVTGVALLASASRNQYTNGGLPQLVFGIYALGGAIPGAIIGPVQLYKAEKYARMAGYRPVPPRLSLPDVGFGNFGPGGTRAFALRTTLTF